MTKVNRFTITFHCPVGAALKVFFDAALLLVIMLAMLVTTDVHVADYFSRLT